MAKSDLAGALADTSRLSKFDGKSVVKTSVSVTNAGDGLSAAMAIEPTEMHHGEKGYILLEFEVVKVVLTPISKDTPDFLERSHALKAGTAVIVSADLAEAHIETQRVKIETARRHAKGEFNLDDEALIVEHDDGQHAGGLRDGCPKCDDERAAAAAEATDAAPDKPKRPGRARGAAKKAAAAGTPAES